MAHDTFGSESLDPADLADFHGARGASFDLPRRDLWRAVVARAWLDAFQPGAARLGERPESEEFERAEARRWLTATFGDYPEDRATVCDLADLDAEMLHRAAVERLSAEREAERPTAEIVDIEAAFARLLDGESTMSPEDLDRALDALAELERAA